MALIPTQTAQTAPAHADRSADRSALPVPDSDSPRSTPPTPRSPAHWGRARPAPAPTPPPSFARSANERAVDVDLQPWFSIDWATPYVGVGVGYGFENLHNLRIGSQNPSQPYTIVSDDTQGNFAFQAMLGVAFPIAAIPDLVITAEYRFFGLAANSEFKGSITSTAPLPAGTTPGSTRLDHMFNHAAMLGIRYAFNSAPPPAAGVMPPLRIARDVARTYLVFFDWDRAELTDRARQVIAEAAQATTRVQVTRIEVNAYTDLSGAARYNQGLSVRRAENVASELARHGVPRLGISVRGFGMSNPLVPTAVGVREPQNRRVEIILRWVRCRRANS